MLIKSITFQQSVYVNSPANKHGVIQLIIYHTQNFIFTLRAVHISPAVIGIYSQSFASAENVVFQ